MRPVIRRSFVEGPKRPNSRKICKRLSDFTENYAGNGGTWRGLSRSFRLRVPTSPNLSYFALLEFELGQKYTAGGVLAVGWSLSRDANTMKILEIRKFSRRTNIVFVFKGS